MDTRRITPEDLKNEHKAVETDSAEIVRRHLEDENHEISDEEIRNVRIGGEDEESIIESKSKFNNDAKDESIEDEDTDLPDPKDKPVTPWDVID